MNRRVLIALLFIAISGSALGDFLPYQLEKQTTVTIAGNIATVALEPDNFTTSEFQNILTAKVQSVERPTDITLSVLSADASGSKSLTIGGSGLYTVYFLLDRLLFKDQIILTQQVYIPYEKPAHAAALAQKYRPVMVFNSSEEYFPVSLEQLYQFGSESNNTINVFAATDLDYSVSMSDFEHFLTYNGNAASSTAISSFSQFCNVRATGCNPTFFRNLRGSPTDATVYWDAQQIGNELIITYHFFYGFDPKGGTSSQPGIASHAFDRESFSIKLSSAAENAVPVSVTYAGHKTTQTMHALGVDRNRALNESLGSWTGGRTVLSWNQALKVGSHPVVYVAKGSHALFPSQGWYAIPAIYNIPALTEEAGSRQNSIPVFPTFSNAKLVELDFTSPGPLRYSGNVVRHFEFFSFARFPPFVEGRTPALTWVRNSQNAFGDCLLGNATPQCNEVRDRFSNIHGISGWGALTVKHGAVTNANLMKGEQITVRALSGQSVLTEKTLPVDNQWGSTFFVTDDASEYQVLLDGVVCGSLTPADMAWQAGAQFLQQFIFFCDVEIISTPPGNANNNGGPGSEQTDSSFVEPVFSVTDENDASVRLSQRWIFDNLNVRLHSQDCAARPEFGRPPESVHGWLNIQSDLRLADRLQTNMGKSVYACTFVRRGMTDFNRTLSESIRNVVCGGFPFFSDSAAILRSCDS